MSPSIVELRGNATPIPVFELIQLVTAVAPTTPDSAEPSPQRPALDAAGTASRGPPAMGGEVCSQNETKKEIAAAGTKLTNLYVFWRKLALDFWNICKIGSALCLPQLCCASMTVQNYFTFENQVLSGLGIPSLSPPPQTPR